MNKPTRQIMLAAVLVTLATIVLWGLTGGDFYTKYEVVRQIQKPVDQNDPLAASGFYDDGQQTETVVTDEFRFGLLPTPTGLFDKHSISVVSVASPFWGMMIVSFLWSRRRRRSPAGPA